MQARTANEVLKAQTNRVRLQKLKGEQLALKNLQEQSKWAFLSETVMPDQERSVFLRGKRLHPDHSTSDEASQPTVWVTPTSGQESHMLSGLAQADCLLILPPGNAPLPKGSPVEYIELNWRKSDFQKSALANISLKGRPSYA